MKKTIIILLLVFVLCLPTLAACDINRVYGVPTVEDKDDKNNSNVKDKTNTEIVEQTNDATNSITESIECDHPFSNMEMHEAKAPTCTEKGWDAYISCSKCGMSNCVEKAALGHDEIIHSAKQPDCENVGWSEYVTCSRCVYTTYAEINAIGHNYNASFVCEQCDMWYYQKYINVVSNNDGTCSINFDGCEAAEKLVIPSILPNGDVVTKIALKGSFAYINNDKTVEVVIPSSVEIIDEYTFAGWIALETIVIPNSVTEIGQGSFVNCSNLKSVELSDKLAVIPYEAFGGCSSLQTVIIPKSVIKLDTWAFIECPIETIYYMGSKEEWEVVDFNLGNEVFKNATIIYNYVPE